MASVILSICFRICITSSSTVAISAALSCPSCVKKSPKFDLRRFVPRLKARRLAQFWTDLGLPTYSRLACRRQGGPRGLGGSSWPLESVKIRWKSPEIFEQEQIWQIFVIVLMRRESESHQTTFYVSKISALMTSYFLGAEYRDVTTSNG